MKDSIQLLTILHTGIIIFGCADNQRSSEGDEYYLIDEGNYYLRYGKDNTIDKGNYINIWKRENGEWKICSNIWNTIMPLNPAEAD